MQMAGGTRLSSSVAQQPYAVNRVPVAVASWSLARGGD